MDTHNANLRRVGTCCPRVFRLPQHGEPTQRLQSTATSQKPQKGNPVNISQAARLSGLSAKQIRDYEKLGLLPPAPRSAAGYRRFTEADAARLSFIRHAREVGFSLAQTARLLELNDNPARKSREVKQLAAEHIAELDEKIQKLQTMRRNLQAWHDQCAGDEQPTCCILAGLGSPQS